MNCANGSWHLYHPGTCITDTFITPHELTSSYEVV